MKEIGIIKIFLKRSGGNIYRERVKNSLSNNFNIDYVSPRTYLKNRYFKAGESFLRILFLKGEKDLWIRDFFSTSFFVPSNFKGKNLALIFHVDFSGLPVIAKLSFWIFEKLFFYRNLRKMDAIVVIAKYWEDFLKNRGFKNIYRIYCGFDIKDFNIADQEILDFKEHNNLTQKPIVYLGNCQKGKGVVESYQALKDLNVHLVTSGVKAVDIPATNFNGSYREYLMLLKASEVAITMSKFKEGWCMTAHEAMLCKTPVIGSGKGGMKELLERGGQIICTDFKF